MRRTVGDALISATALLFLLLALVSVDERVRERVAALFHGAISPSELASVGGGITDAAVVVFEAAMDQSVEHAPLLLFTLAATVLVLFMART